MFYKSLCLSETHKKKMFRSCLYFRQENGIVKPILAYPLLYHVHIVTILISLGFRAIWARLFKTNDVVS